MASGINGNSIRLKSVTPYASYMKYSGTSNFNHKNDYGVKAVIGIQNVGELQTNVKYQILNSPWGHFYKWALGADYGFNLSNANVNMDLGAKYMHFHGDGDTNHAYSVWAGATSEEIGSNTGCKIGGRIYYTNMTNVQSGLYIWQIDAIAKKAAVSASFGKVSAQNVISYIALGTENFDGKKHYLTDTLSANLQTKSGAVYGANVSFGKQALKINAANGFSQDTTAMVYKWGVGVNAKFPLQNGAAVKLGWQHAKVNAGDNPDATINKFTIAFTRAF
jgi:hypothetical protein